MTTKMDFTAWTQATGDLLPGQQAVFLDVLNLVAEGKTHLVWGADYRDGKPCLVNAVGQMLTTGGGNSIPMQYFGNVVRQFDTLNSLMHDLGINEDGYVSPLAAEFLIRNFGEVKPIVRTEVAESVTPEGQPYIEPTDAEFMQSWLSAMAAPAPEDVAADPSPEAEYVRAYVEHPNG